MQFCTSRQIVSKCVHEARSHAEAADAGEPRQHATWSCFNLKQNHVAARVKQPLNDSLGSRFFSLKMQAFFPFSQLCMWMLWELCDEAGIDVPVKWMSSPSGPPTHWWLRLSRDKSRWRVRIPGSDVTHVEGPRHCSAKWASIQLKQSHVAGRSTLQSLGDRAQPARNPDAGSRTADARRRMAPRAPRSGF